MERRTFMALVSGGRYDLTLGVVLRLAKALGVPMMGLLE